MALIDQIRVATTTLHEALHHHLLLSPLVSEKVTLIDYQFALAAFSAHYRRWERAFADFKATELPNAPVLDWISHDTEKSFNDASAVPFSLDPEPFQFGNSVTEAHYMGYLYTKQGSTLGGMVISRNLREKLHLAPGIDQHFFAGYGTETGTHWKQFLDRFVIMSKPFDPNLIIAGAVQAFESVTHYCNIFLTLKQQNDSTTQNRTDRTAA